MPCSSHCALNDRDQSTLPSAARARGLRRGWSARSQKLDRAAWHEPNSGADQPVDRKPQAGGLYDILGNVGWVQDWDGLDYTQQPGGRPRGRGRVV